MKQLPLSPATPNERALANVYAETFTGVTGLTLALAYEPALTVNGVGLEQLYKNGTLIAAGSGVGGSTQVRETRDDLAGGITSLGRVGSLATAITSGTNSLVSGDEVTIDGADQAEYNGDFTVTVLNNTTFTYGVGGSPLVVATGAISWGAKSFTLLQTPTSEPELLFRGGSQVSPNGGAGGYTRTGSRIAMGTALTPTSRVLIWYRTGGGGYTIAGKVITFDVALVSTDVVVVHYSYRN